MENKKPQQIDDFFKDELGEITPSPSFENWKKIASELEGEAFDGFMKNQLKDSHPSPNPQIWNNIKKKLPLSILVRNQLNWLSRIAAVLVIFMIVILILDKNETKPTTAEIAIPNTPTATNIDISEDEPVDFVFAINENKDKNQGSASEELSLEDEKTIEDFWSGVMNDDDEFMADVDEDVIDNSLKPLLQLPIENLEAALPKKENVVAKKQLPINQPTPFLLPNSEKQISDK